MPYIFPDSSVNTDLFTDNNASGGEGGEHFNFIKASDGAILTKIKAWKNDWRIRAVQVWMSDGSTYLAGQRGGESNEFSFLGGEQITRLNVQASSTQSSVLKRRRLGAIWFETNKGRGWGIFSDDLEESGCYWPDVGSGICCGVFGFAGHDVDRLGFAMLRIVKRAKLTDVRYPTLSMEIVASTPSTVARQQFCNGTDKEQTFTLSGSKTVSVTREWTLTTQLSMSFSVQVTAGIPEVVSVSSGFSWSISMTSSHAVSSTTTETKEWKWPLVCPPHRKILGEATMYSDVIDTEYEGTMKLYLTNGKTFKYSVKGVYTGLNARSGIVKIWEEGPCP